ncbi:unnamed protein product [Ranitomeya imitator]|uniref:Laminin EGF-like domain-containing protein n=1 Tax=Ranitomeya imitator TaxID=111125 RepID=A0ABN9MAT1_9NEOB|nr:unnamed protein product [Ranitomeya imitator]
MTSLLMASTAENCSGYRTCAQCLEQPGCGWCTDPSNTGKGQCMEASSRGPMRMPNASAIAKAKSEPVLDPGLCPSDNHYNWSFIHCPGIIGVHRHRAGPQCIERACQCNGHSKCINESICEKCQDLTTGKNCDSCISGYYGDPTNGGSCQPCKCNGHASVCNTNSGKCFCTTKGIKGEECQLCEVENRYQGNPLKGTCYYTLLIDYQFTFSLSQEDDKYYTAINFVATPEEQNRDLDMFINASKNFNLNITWAPSFAAGTQTGEEIPIISRTNIKEYKDTFSNEKFDFHNNPNITFFVYVSNFTWSIKIQTFDFSLKMVTLRTAVISAVTSGTRALHAVTEALKLFIDINSCLTLATEYEFVIHPYTQQLIREMQQMASRPFASVNVALETDEEPPDLIGGSVKGHKLKHLKALKPERCVTGDICLLASAETQSPKKK